MPSIKRRTFLGIALASIPLPMLDELGAHGSLPPGESPAASIVGLDALHDHALPQQALYVPAGQDRDGVHKTLGISTVDFKVTSKDSGGTLLIIENTNRGKGGPAKHLHDAQDEHFYVIEGEYVIVIGAERFALKAGDSILAPRKVPHVWAYVGTNVGRLLISFTPPGLMEPFFREVSKGNAMPPQDPAIWRAHGMELLGPPLPV